MKDFAHRYQLRELFEAIELAVLCTYGYGAVDPATHRALAVKYGYQLTGLATPLIWQDGPLRGNGSDLQRRGIGWVNPGY